MGGRPALAVADIYCGAGGLSVGFAQAAVTDPELIAYGFDIVFGVDRDTDAILSFRRNHFEHPSNEEAKHRAPQRTVVGLTGHDILAAAGVDRIPVLIGGPNCQGVSPAGLRNPNDRRNEMFRHFRRLLRELRPDWFVMENVPGLAQANNRGLLTEILKELEDITQGEGPSKEGDQLRYTVAADVLLAADFGVPQLRYRLFIVGNCIGRPIRFPHPTHAPPGNPLGSRGNGNLRPSVTVRDRIADLAAIVPSIVHEGRKRSEDTVLGVPENHVVPDIGIENLDRMRHIPEGGDWRWMPTKQLPMRYMATRASDQVGAYGRLRWDAPAYTITGLANNVTAGMFTHPSGLRPISAREAARLQGFQDQHVFVGAPGSAYRQIGNAVPPPLAEAIAMTLLHCHYWPERADEWGTKGRITLEALAAEGRRSLPVLTPRHGNVLRPRRLAVPRGGRSAYVDKEIPQYEPDPANRQPMPAERLEALRREAVFPRNLRSARRARTILAYFEGKTAAELESEARASERSFSRWVDGFFREGVEGWRAYHTPTARLARGDVELERRLSEAIDKVRDRACGIAAGAKAEVDKSAAGNGAGKQSPRPRAFVNPYLETLRERFGGYSTWELLGEAEGQLGTGLGTVYVGDLLAICDVLGVPPRPFDAKIQSPRADRERVDRAVVAST